MTRLLKVWVLVKVCEEVALRRTVPELLLKVPAVMLKAPLMEMVPVGAVKVEEALLTVRLPLRVTVPEAEMRLPPVREIWPLYWVPLPKFNEPLPLAMVRVPLAVMFLPLVANWPLVSMVLLVTVRLAPRVMVGAVLPAAYRPAARLATSPAERARL